MAAMAITYGRVARVDTWGDSGVWEIAASAFLLAGFVILASTATGCCDSRSRENEKRIDALAERAESAEETLRNEEETLHELRGAIAGIGSASRILTGMSAGLDTTQQKRLVDLLSIEMDRLERLLTGPARPLRGRAGPGDRRPRVRLPLRRHADPLLRLRASAWAVASDVTDVIHVLLNNAARHAPGATTMVWVRQRHDRVDLHVSDEGPGIRPRCASRLFDRGVRADESPGQGLGLYIARRVLEQHGEQPRAEGRPAARDDVRRQPAPEGAVRADRRRRRPERASA